MRVELEARDGRLQRLQALTDATLAHLRLDELLEALLLRTRELLSVDTCAVLLLDEETNELAARASVGYEGEVDGGRAAVAGGDFAGRVAATKKPVVLDEVDGAGGLDPIERARGVKSMLGVSLLAAGETVGVLYVGSLAPRSFGHDEVELLQLAADRAAIAIEHARLLEAERRARERIEHVQAVTDAALAHLDARDLLSVLLPRIREILRTDTCAVLLLDEETNELVARAAVGIDEEVEAEVRIPVGGGFAGRVAATKQPVILDDVDHADVLNPILRERGVKSMLGVPLLVAGQAIGVLHVGTLTPRRFVQADVELLQLAADRAAVALEHARLFEAERRARERIEHVQAVTDAALAHLDLDELLSVLLPRIREILRADTCAVLLLEKKTNELVARAAVGIEEEVEAGVRIPVGRGFAGRVASQKSPIVLDDVATANVLNPILREKGITSMLGVPLLIGGDAIGVMHVGSLVQRRFRSSDIELLQLVAARVAIAIERAQLHEETVLLDQLKLNFVAIASHELRTPTTSVYGALATLRARPELPEETREELLEVAYEQVDRLRRLLEQLLDLSRLDAKAMAVAPRPLVLRSVLGEIAASALPSETAVRLDVPPDLAAVADPLVLERVVSNLLINAAQHGAPPIRVTASRGDRHLRVCVEDEGEGVPEELRTRLFERFSHSDARRGSGLGLAIARTYAQAHGGDLVYHARPRGSRFELIVPQE